MGRKFSFSILLLCGLLLMVFSAWADVFIKEKHHSDGFTIMGQTQPPKDTFQSIWFSTDKVRSDQEDKSTILRLDLNLLYIIDHKKKSYVTIPLNFGATQKENMPEGLGIKISVTPTGESKKINNWNCKKYLQKTEMMGMSIDSEVWATEDIKLDFELYSKFVSAAMQMMPGMQADMEKMMNEVKKIKGIQVLTITTNKMMGQTMKSTQELVEFKEAKAPAGIFDPPAGYKKEKMEKMFE